MVIKKKKKKTRTFFTFCPNNVVQVQKTTGRIIIYIGSTICYQHSFSYLLSVFTKDQPVFIQILFLLWFLRPFTVILLICSRASLVDRQTKVPVANHRKSRKSCFTCVIRVALEHTAVGDDESTQILGPRVHVFIIFFLEVTARYSINQL